MTPTTDLAALTRLVDVAGRDVLDVGCGGGWLARALAGEGARVTALEIDEQRLAPARDADDDTGSVTYAVGRAEALPLDDGQIDVVVFMRSLHHVPIDAMSTALSEARRVLRPGGTVYVSEPLPEGDWFELQSVIEVETETRAAAQAALAAAGDHGLRHRTRERYETETELADATAFSRHMHAVDPEREQLLRERHATLEATFARIGAPAPGGRGRVLRHVNQADVLIAD